MNLLPFSVLAVAAQFIGQYVTRYKRWLSPKFVAGESYGTTRAAAAHFDPSFFATTGPFALKKLWADVAAFVGDAR
jgi:hypothetical protein